MTGPARLVRLIAAPTLLLLAAIAFADDGADAKKQPPEKPAAGAKATNKVPPNPFPGRRPAAPPLDDAEGWLNADKPIRLEDLRGKIVLLDFWTFCCINCMHILPDLTKLEHEFANELVVIGVHSAKFNNEKDTDNIRNAVVRYDIRHPVANDAQMAIWRRYGARAWPTLVLIDPEGNVVGGVSGEGNYEVLRSAISKLVDYYGALGKLDRTPKNFPLEAAKLQPTPLRFPGKIIVDAASDRMAIADSGHNRVVAAKLSTGEVLAVAGSGKMGLRDGPFDAAEFDDPQGLAIRGDILFVADRRNHAIRKLNLNTRTVETIAGTGVQSYDRTHSGPAKQTPLASPWDVLWIDDALFIAMAGLHQIWKLELATGIVGPWAGSGREDIINGTKSASAFAQPSGLTTDGKWLYVADSEVSAVRKVSLTADEVKTLVGEGLFEFGDQDGTGPRVRLQHALGVAWAGGKIYVADTYNNKIRLMDAQTGDTTTLFGDGWAGSRDAPARFDHPGGLCFADGKVYVADTNNHVIRVIDPAKSQVSTWTIKGLSPPAPPGGTQR